MIAIYIRTSTNEQAPELQLNDIRSIIEKEPDIIFQEKISAFKDNILRPEFEKLKKLISERKLTALYIWHIDRIFRNRKKLLEFLAFCKNHHVSIFSFNQKWLESIQTITPPFNEIMFDLMLQIIGFMAEDESATKSKRVKMAVKTDLNGNTISYKGNKWGRKQFPKQTENKVIALYQTGKSIREIAAEVQVYDKNKNSRNISKSAVHKIIVNFKSKKGS